MGSPVIICGMHRSGTSLVASVLRQAGVDIGRELKGGGRGNVHGHFEDEDFFRLHEDMLGAAGQGCYTTDADLSAAVSSSFEGRARALIAQRSVLPLWGWKDPRSCLFLDFWDRLLPTAAFVMLYRHPVDVALSLWRRDTERELRRDPWLAIHAWEVYNRLLLRFRQRHPGRCFLAQVPALTADLGGFVEQVAAKLDLPLRKEGAADLFFADELAPESSAESLRGASRLAGALEIYRQLVAAADLPGQLVTPAPTAATGRGMARQEELFGFVVASSQQLRSNLEEQRQRISELSSELGRRRRRTAELEADLAAMRARLGPALEQRDELAKVLARIESSRSFGLVRACWWLLGRLRRVLPSSRRPRAAAGAVLPFSARAEARRDTATGQRAATSLAPPAG